MNKQEVIALMESSKSVQEWDDNCGKVQKAFGGYPSFWFAEILQTKLAERTLSAFGRSSEIKIVLS